MECRPSLVQSSLFQQKLCFVMIVVVGNTMWKYFNLTFEPSNFVLLFRLSNRYVHFIEYFHNQPNMRSFYLGAHVRQIFINRKGKIKLSIFLKLLSRNPLPNSIDIFLMISFPYVVLFSPFLCLLNNTLSKFLVCLNHYGVYCSICIVSC